MKTADLHPEHLLERARRAALGPGDAALLEQHASECSACAMELRLIRDFASVPLDLGETDAVARLVHGALNRAEQPSAHGEQVAPHPQSASRSRRRGPLWAAAAMVLLVASGGVAAGYFLGVRQGANEPPTQTPRSSEPQPQDAPEPPPADAAVEADEMAKERVEDAHPRQRGARRIPARPSAEDLLSRASSARRQGDYDAASKLYRTLQRRFPASREASVSRVALGRLLLDDLRDPAGALAQFDRYLRRAPQGSLALEARVGRAIALDKLGRTAQERRAWEDVVRRHPDSVHADRAQQRLRALSRGP